MYNEKESKTKLSEIDDIPTNNFQKLLDLIRKGRYKLRVNLYYFNYIERIKTFFNKKEYLLFKIGKNLFYFYLLLIILASLLTSNYYILIGLPILLLLKNSGALDFWIIILFSIILFILILIFKFDSSAFYVILSFCYLTYFTDKIVIMSFVNKTRKLSLKNEQQFINFYLVKWIRLSDDTDEVFYEKVE